MKTIRVDRSRVQEFQHCPRKRWLSYHEGGLGISSAKTPLPLVVGLAVHTGLASLLADSMNVPVRASEDSAVAAALADFHAHDDAIALDTLEDAAITVATARPPGLPDDFPGLADIEATVGRGKSEFDKYFSMEQAALVEGLVRAYARRRLRPLLEQFEVLEVEREGEWRLSEFDVKVGYSGTFDAPTELWFMSRPDALLRERGTNQLYLLSYKTAASWDVRKARDAEHDMQGLSEGVEIERRLADWHTALKVNGDTHEPISPAMRAFLMSCDAPPRIHAIRYEYMLKGDRWRDKDLASRFGFDARAQRSSLVRGYLSAGMASGDEQWCHSWDYLKADGSGQESKLNYRQWKSEAVWPHMTIAKWIDLLDDTTMTVAESGGDLGYSGPAQSVGYTATHPLDDAFIPPIVIYRSDDDLRDWIEQTESQERRVAEAVVQVEAAADEDSRRSLLNVHFWQSRRACSYPTECQFVPVCYGGADIRRDPLGSGRYKVRTVNHPMELSK